MQLSAKDLDVKRVGSGPPVVLVHGSVVGADRTWRRQLELAGEWSLIVPNRPGFGASPPLASDRSARSSSASTTTASPGRRFTMNDTMQSSHAAEPAIAHSPQSIVSTSPMPAA